MFAAAYADAVKLRYVEVKMKDNYPRNIWPWTWLLAGFGLLPFTFFQTVSPLAGWLAPVFLLRFARTSPLKPRHTLLILRLACVAALLAANRGLPFNLLGILGNILLKGLLYSLPYTIDLSLSRRLQGWARALVFPLAYTTVDWLISLTPLSSSGSLAYSQDGNLVLLQIISVTGMWAITFLIAWLAAIANECWEQGLRVRAVRGHAIAFASLLAGALIFGGVRLALNPPAADTVPAAAITADPGVATRATREIDWARLNPADNAQRAALRPAFQATTAGMLEKTEKALQNGAKIAAWQESSAWVLEEDRQVVLERAAALARQSGATLQISLEVLTHAAKMPYLRNQSILIDAAGNVVWVYDKTHPSPFDEAFATIAGPGILPLAEGPYGRLSTAICYDTYYPALLRQAGKNGVGLLFSPANDVPQFAASALAMADYRAIENGFAMLRSTDQGFSALVDPLGRILARQDYAANPGGILLAALPTNGVSTLYSRTGDWFAYLNAAGLALLAGWASLRHPHPAPTYAGTPASGEITR
jgi:apolipoprotein N-acyltransferase